MNKQKAIWTVIWKITLFLLMWGVLYAPPLLLAVKRFQQAGDIDSPSVRLYFELTGALTILIAAWVMTRFIDKRSFTSLGFTPNRITRDVLLGLGIGLGMMAISVAVLWSAGWAIPQAGVPFSLTVLAVVGVAMLANTVTQEVLVRGYIQQTIQLQFGPVLAVVISAFIFMLLHLGAIKGAPLPAVNLFAAGILLGVAYAVTHNLWLPIALHFGWNFLQGPVLGLTVSGQSVDSGWRVFRLAGPDLFTGGAFGLEGGLVATATTVLGIMTLLLLLRSPSYSRGWSKGRGSAEGGLEGF
jgi:membrane protease YdiL (CAAX protease family)